MRYVETIRDELRGIISFYSIIGLVLALVLFYLIRSLNYKEYFPIVIISFTFLLQWKPLMKQFRGIKSLDIQKGFIIFLFLHFLYLAFQSFQHIREWDYIAFYFYALAGVSGENFYDPVLFEQILVSHPYLNIVSDTFMQEVVQVGFNYPPPTMLILVPLGWFSLETSFVIWQSILLFFYFVNFYLLFEIFLFNGTDRFSFTNKNFESLIIIIIILAFPYLTSSLWYSQTNPFLLFFVLLFIKRINHWDSGIYLTLMVLIKPLAVIFGLFLLFRLKWRIIFALLLSGISILILTGIIFDFEIFLLYFTSPPTQRLPDYLYFQPINKSLSAVLLRLHHNSFPDLSKFFFTILTIILSALTLILSLFIAFKIHTKSIILSFLLIIPCALIIYPASLAHYSLLLIPVIIAFYKHLNKKVPEFYPVFFVIICFGLGLLNLFYLNTFLLLSFTLYLMMMKTQQTSAVRKEILPGGMYN